MSASNYNFPNVQWGWRLQCCHPNYDHSYTHYQPRHLSYDEKTFDPRTGPPPIVSVPEMMEQGWYCKWQRGGVPSYYALCPEHAAPDIAWPKAMDAWDLERRKAAKARAEHETTIMERLAAWFDSKVLGRKIRPYMKQWWEENPRPTPPWKEAA